MTCLKPELIHRYLENDLDSSQARELERHLALCSGCRAALEERQVLMDAVGELPDVDIPPEMTAEIMSRIPAAREPSLSWLPPVLIGIPALVLGALIFFIVSGAGGPLFLSGGNRSQWTFVREAGLLFIKIMKLAWIGFNILLHFTGRMFEALTRFAADIKPETLAGAALLLLTLTALFLMGIRKKSYHGEES